MKFPTLSKENPLHLASASARRKSLLKQLRLPFRSSSSAMEEDPTADEASFSTLRLAEAKAKSVLPLSGPGWILGADTVVVLDGAILGKPGTPDEASATLSLLSGREHRVITGFCLLDPLGTTAHAEAVETFVSFRRLSRHEVEAYVATGEPFGKAGSYAIQGIGAFLVEGIRGSYTNVVGLPLCELVKALLAVGALSAYPLPDSFSAGDLPRE